MRISDLMVQSRVNFGTSGARGLAKDMTDRVCYAYTAAFIQYLEAQKQLNGSGTIAVGGDLRASTDRIMRAAAKAVADRDYAPLSCGRLPSPALANYGLMKGIPTIMVTGSHIPEDRNGIKYTKREGEILKQDEQGIRRQEVTLPRGLFDKNGMFGSEPGDLLPDTAATDLYVDRYLQFFPHAALKGKRIGVYQHSAVGRDLMVTILSGLGAEVTPLAPSETFIPVDTEAIRPEDIEAASRWAKEYEFDAIVSTDGDSDRPLISDENGKWLRGDVAGIMCSAYFKADAVATPVSCNTALEKCGWFHRVYRTKIGSPFVIEGMEQALRDGARRVVGYEANAGFLIASDIESAENILKALPTRDAVILHIAILLLSIENGKTISELVAELPQRFTYSNRLKEFPTEKSSARINALNSGNRVRDKEAIEAIFGESFGPVVSVDTTDGLRITFETDEIVHLRPSGNAPEFRCYNEAGTESRAMEMNQICMDIMAAWR
ncbi:MAG: phosphomannomutase [Desulfobacteraceae bacterium]|nr:phosphomannomutase [Desulfobacterales bacterium]MBL6968075.1 phosphomannomutase [Desulfobacteraceae bacterium]MBL7101380.1 phosphomannomutase [Desulfobacteraceae bacterium]MBL7172505.1 phosphomannomutase [Desulfobacteraceae bacterium]